MHAAAIYARSLITTQPPAAACSPPHAAMLLIMRRRLRRRAVVREDIHAQCAPTMPISPLAGAGVVPAYAAAILSRILRLARCCRNARGATADRRAGNRRYRQLAARVLRASQRECLRYRPPMQRGKPAAAHFAAMPARLPRRRSRFVTTRVRSAICVSAKKKRGGRGKSASPRARRCRRCR